MKKVRYILKEIQFAMVALAFFALAVAAVMFFSQENKIATELCQMALLFAVLSGVCDFARTNI